MPRIAIKDIKISSRFREDYGDVENLAVSISKYGLLQPIVVDREHNLLAGERRIRAHLLLGLLEIDVTYIDAASELIKREIEIEENLRRKGFEWQEEVKAFAELHRIKQQLYKPAIKGHGGGWGLQETAESQGVSIGTASQDVRLAEAILEYPELANEPNKMAAWKKYLRLRKSELENALAEKVSVKVESAKCFVLGDARQVFKGLPSNSADLLLTDPLYGIGIDNSKHMKEVWGELFSEGTMDDESCMDINRMVLKECFRVLKPDRHAFIFFAIQFYEKITKMLVEAGFEVNPLPCIWDKMSIGMGNSDYSYTNQYETFFHCMKGTRKVNKMGIGNVFNLERVSSIHKIHPTEKPTYLLRQLIENTTLRGELVIDPFAGSASTLRAAFECSRLAFGCEINKEYHNKGIILLDKLATQGE